MSDAKCTIENCGTKTPLDWNDKPRKYCIDHWKQIADGEKLTHKDGTTTSWKPYKRESMKGGYAAKVTTDQGEEVRTTFNEQQLQFMKAALNGGTLVGGDEAKKQTNQKNTKESLWHEVLAAKNAN